MTRSWRLLTLDLFPAAAGHAVRCREGVLRALTAGALDGAAEHDGHAERADRGRVGAVLALHLELAALELGGLVLGLGLRDAECRSRGRRSGSGCGLGAELLAGERAVRLPSVFRPAEVRHQAAGDRRDRGARCSPAPMSTIWMPHAEQMHDSGGIGRVRPGKLRSPCSLQLIVAGSGQAAC